MGAAVGVELALPVDGSDIETDNLGMARGEVVRLRNALGHLAKQAGFGDVVYDASDLCLGRDNQEDFDRCLGEVIHIRSALRLSTQGSKRRARPEYVDQATKDWCIFKLWIFLYSAGIIYNVEWCTMKP